MRTLALAGSVLCLLSCAPRAPLPEAPSQPAPVSKPGFAEAAGTEDYWSPDCCVGCHDEISAQHAASDHETSFSNPVFQAQYFQEVLPRASGDAAVLEEAARCTACHSPVTFVRLKGALLRAEQAAPRMAGVTCDFCHTISGYTGERPQDGNYISSPGQRKFGPFRHEYNWHHYYAELQTKSEFCGICHNATNHHGVEVKSTFREWEESRFAQRGIQCQDCHMSVSGRLVAGAPRFASGHAAHMTMGAAPERERLFSHRFPGMHSAEQLSGAVTLSLGTEQRPLARGDEIAVDVLVTNYAAGHKLPTGSSDLRQMWLSLEARIDDTILAIAAAPAAGSDGFDVAGKGKFDADILGADIPAGSRLYRTIFLDAHGRQTLRSYEATRLIFDNRLGPSETRKESYRFVVPSHARGKIVLRASVNYLPYPSSFATRLGLPPAESFEIVSTSRSLLIR